MPRSSTEITSAVAPTMTLNDYLEANPQRHPGRRSKMDVWMESHPAVRREVAQAISRGRAPKIVCFRYLRDVHQLQVSDLSFYKWAKGLSQKQRIKA
jgi:hypothetical protein